MRSRYAAFIFTVALLIAAWAILEAQQRGGGPAGVPGAGRGGGPQPPVGSMPSRRFEKITEGVYYVTSSGSMSGIPFMIARRRITAPPRGLMPSNR